MFSLADNIVTISGAAVQFSSNGDKAFTVLPLPYTANVPACSPNSVGNDRIHSQNWLKVNCNPLRAVQVIERTRWNCEEIRGDQRKATAEASLMAYFLSTPNRA